MPVRPGTENIPLYDQVQAEDEADRQECDGGLDEAANSGEQRRLGWREQNGALAQY